MKMCCKLCRTLPLPFLLRGRHEIVVFHNVYAIYDLSLYNLWGAAVTAIGGSELVAWSDHLVSIHGFGRRQ